VTATLQPDTIIPYELGYLYAHFAYRISSPKSVFSIQSTVAADLGDYTKLGIRYLAPDGVNRTILITGGSGRVVLNPALVSGLDRVRQTRHRAHSERRRSPAVSTLPDHSFSPDPRPYPGDNRLYCRAFGNIDRNRV
jgi:hypothetical protein